MARHASIRGVVQRERDEAGHWMGLACFGLDVIYRVARWGVMLSLSVALILFVALSEKKRIVATLRGYYDEARSRE